MVFKSKLNHQIYLDKHKCDSIKNNIESFTQLVLRQDLFYKSGKFIKFNRKWVRGCFSSKNKHSNKDIL